MKNFAHLCNLVQYLRPYYHHQAYCLLHYNLICCPLRSFPFQQGVTRPLGIIIAVSPCGAYHHAGHITMRGVSPRGLFLRGYGRGRWFSCPIWVSIAFPPRVGPREWSGPRVFSLMALFLRG